LLSLKDPSGNVVTSGYCGNGAGSYFDTVTLATNGTYTIFVDPQGAATGNVTLSINNDSDVTGTIAIDGSAVTTTTTVEGQDAVLTFSATAGQRIFVQLTNSTNPGATLELLTPASTIQASTYFNNGSAPFFIDTQTLATTGTYSLKILHSGTNVGSETLQLYSVPADLTGTITIGGAAVRVPATGNTAIGQNATLTFSATAGQNINLNWTGATYAQYYSCTFQLRDPNGNLVTSGYCGNGASSPVGASITVTGTHTILIDPQGPATGTVTLSLTTQ
jgi:hypothetical protein